MPGRRKEWARRNGMSEEVLWKDARSPLHLFAWTIWRNVWLRNTHDVPNRSEDMRDESIFSKVAAQFLIKQTLNVR